MGLLIYKGASMFNRRYVLKFLYLEVEIVSFELLTHIKPDLSVKLALANLQ